MGPGCFPDFDLKLKRACRPNRRSDSAPRPAVLAVVGEGMGTSVQVTPLSGAYGEGPLCYLLSVDGFRFLLDCGWTDRCDPALLQPLARYPASTYPVPSFIPPPRELACS
jgi:hypothetical protein